MILVEPEGSKSTETGTPQATKPPKIEEEYSLSPADVAAFLQELANPLQKGSVIEMGTAAQNVGITPNQPIKLEIGYKEDPKKMKKKLQITLEIEEIQMPTAQQGARPKIGPIE